MRAHDRAPSTTLPLAYMLVAVPGFLVAALGVPALASELSGHYYHPRLLALTHTLTLGWVTATIMGASYQLVPIVLQCPLWSERLARWQLVVLVVGMTGMIAHFFIAEASGLVWAAALVALAVGLHVVNLGASLRRLTQWTFTARMIVFGLAGLVAATLSGAILGAAHVRGPLPAAFFAFLHAHVHLALLGWVAPVLVGVAARVYPMFFLAPGPGSGSAAIQLGGLALGAPLVVVGLVTHDAVTALGALACAGALGAHALWVARLIGAARRPALDWPLRFVVTAPVFLVIAMGAGLALAFGIVRGPRAALVYAVLGLGGWISLSIAGMLLKIVPFLVWHRVYGPRVGRTPVPLLGGLGWPVAERAAYALLVPGLLALTVAIGVGETACIRWAGISVAAGALAFALSVARVVAHALPGIGGWTRAAVPAARPS
jgi:hypothetical protein